MVTSTLTIRYCRERQRATVAWFIPGGGPEQWLTELAAWPLDMLQLTLRPLPAERGGGPLAGVLVTTGDERPQIVSPRCQEYGVLADRCYLPVEARLDPLALESEIADLLAGSDDDYVFHPSIGLVRIERRERLGVADLLQPPPCAETDWTWARPGAAPIRPLVSVEPVVSPTADEILFDAQDDIATEDLEDAPQRAPFTDGDAPQGGGTGRRLGRAMRRLRDMLQHALGGQSGHRDAANQATERDGNRPVDRLLRLLSENPDEGLRYAVPLEGAPRRGSAPAGDQLTRQHVDFNLRRLTASGPAGVWHVTQQRYESLCGRYRELANRELALHRYRRAAYIFAHLLGDLRNAAAALQAGGHWREAAVLYRDRLNSPRLAAECLEHGQLWTEAIDAYQQLEMFENVGDLYRKIDQDQQAVEAYRRAMLRSLTSGDHLAAAQIAEQKLNAPHEALRCLAAAWPDASQAVACLQQMFTTLASHGQHEDAKRLVDQTDPCLVSEHRAAKAVHVLADVAIEYPDPEVRTLAADRVRVAVGRLLSDESGGHVDELVQDVRRLVPADRLLARDCQRFEELARLAQAARARRTSPARPREAWHLVWSFNLPRSVDWVSAAGGQEAAYVAGYEDNSFVLVRLPFSPSIAERTMVSWPISPSLTGAPVLLCPDPQEQSALIAHVVGAAGEPPAADLPPSDDAPRRVFIGGGHFLTPRTRGVARSADSLTWVVEHEKNRLALRHYGSEGRVLGSHVVPLPPHVTPDDISALEYVPMAATATHVYVAVRDCVVCIRRGVRVTTHRMKSPILDVFVPCWGRPVVAVIRCAREVVALWNDATEDRLELLDDTMSGAVCGWTRDGRIALADGLRFELYVRKEGHFERTASGAHHLTAPLAILPARQPSQVLILCRHGEGELLNLR